MCKLHGCLHFYKTYTFLLNKQWFVNEEKKTEEDEKNNDDNH